MVEGKWNTVVVPKERVVHVVQRKGGMKNPAAVLQSSPDSVFRNRCGCMRIIELIEGDHVGKDICASGWCAMKRLGGY